jgi:hypothetical protein
VAIWQSWQHKPAHPPFTYPQPTQICFSQPSAIFVQTCPLDPAPVRDTQPHLNPNERVGTVLLPLWRQTPRMNSHSPHWPAFLELLRLLRPHLIACSNAMKFTAPWAHGCALELYREQLFSGNPANVIPQPVNDNCFETFRLSANMALDPHLLITTHQSFWAVIVAVGPFDLGVVWLLDLDNLYHVGNDNSGFVPAEHILTVRTSLNIQNLAFTGERYQLEFFLPWKPMQLP